MSYRAVTDNNASHYRVTSMQTIVNPTPMHDNDVPAYPPRLVARHLPPLRVRVKLIVNTKGRVSAMRFAQADTSKDTRGAFQDAVRKAVSQWTFQPLTIDQWVTDPDGSQRVVKRTPKPFSQDYVFCFWLRNGKPVVSSGAGDAPANCRRTSHGDRSGIPMTK